MRQVTRRSLWFTLIVLAVVTTGCRSEPDGKVYDVEGQILDLQPGDRIVTMRHEDIPGFMPAMTMPFKVKDEALLAGRRRGDVVKARLLVTGTDAYLTSLDVVGHRDLAPSTTAPPPPPVDLLDPGDEVPDVELIDANGQSLPFSSLRGSVVALTFIYTRCPLPQFCPLMDRQFRALSDRVRQSPALREGVRILSISFDPGYDTPAVLAAHARKAGADGRTWRFVTADRAAIDSFAPRFGVVLMRDDPNTITHNLRTAIVDRKGRLVKIFNGGDWAVDELAAELVRVAGST